MQYICFAVALFACIIGKICGMGGGVIIKPVLDACGIMSVAEINFLSGCTVLGMSCWSVGKSVLRKESDIDWEISTPLAIGAAFGGLLGKELFNLVEGCFVNANTAGGVQAALLFAATLGTLFYTVFKNRIRGLRVRNKILCVFIGLCLGTMGAFLGIGGGPFNMAVLFFFFSMPTKVAAQNSLYIILLSQTFSLLKTLFSGNVPAVSPWILVGMIACGVLGSEIGGRANKRLQDNHVTRLFEGAMILVLCISIYNMIRFVA